MTTDVAPWWSRSVGGAVACLRGATMRDVAATIDPLPGDAPAFVLVAPGGRHTRSDLSDPSTLASDVVDDLERAAMELVRVWLPGADALDGASTLDRRAARASARRMAGATDHFGPYLAHIADAAVASLLPRADAFSRETRARGSTRVIASAYGRDRAALVLAAPVGAGADSVAAAAAWLASATATTVWLLGADDVERFPSVRLGSGAESAGDSRTFVDKFTPPTYPPVAGHPHPGSATEMRLFRLLGTRPWARGRLHNRTVRLGPLSRPFTVDVLWPDEKVIVEIDGREHRAEGMYSADRARDNDLQTHGYLVLRFVDSDVTGDHERVLAVVERALAARRDPEKPDT